MVYRTDRRNPLYGESGYKRREHDAYWTEARCVESLLRWIDLPPGPFWEPCCGLGHVSRVLASAGLDVVESDLFRHAGAPPPGPRRRYGVDFLTARPPFPFRTIVTNSPFGDAATFFIRRALELLPPDGVACFLLRHAFDAQPGRTDIFRDCPLWAQKLTLLYRPWWTESRDNKPRHEYAWFVWRADHRGPPRILYAE